MPKEHFDIVFCGKLLEGQDPASVQERVGHIFKASQRQLERLFSGRPIAIKKAVDMETASRYRLVFRQAGALVEIHPSNTPETRKPEMSSTPPVGWALLPPNTGTLEDYAAHPTPSPPPDIRHLTLATSGAELDASPPPATAHVDTSGLGLVEGQDWTLEDCQRPPLPQVLPDIEDLTLANLDTPLDQPPPPSPISITTDDLELVPGQDWTLEDCQRPPLPQVLPDLGDLALEEPVPSEGNPRGEH